MLLADMDVPGRTVREIRPITTSAKFGEPFCDPPSPGYTACVLGPKWSVRGAVR